jgi:CHASE2 domain-containing sensor protein/tRNA A-37 threonylcarbamoyl transferase component Bud32
MSESECDAAHTTMQGSLLNGRYRVIKVLGAGGFGQTYLAEDTQHPEQIQCVVKQFKPASHDSKFLKVARRLFETEVETLAQLGQHDQIPQFFDSFEENREFYLVQEFIDGIPLSDELAQMRCMKEADVIALLKDVLGVLEFVHDNRVIHRDIKPENLIRRYRDHKVVLIDFGAVKQIRTQMLTGSGETRLTVGIGTEGYTPSEQLAGKPRFCSDIYALGITAIQALTGMQPFQLQSDLDTGELLWRDYASVSLGLALVLDKMVRYHFSQRYQSVGDALYALDHLSQLPTELTDIPISALSPDAGNEGFTQIEPTPWWRRGWRESFKGVAIATLAVSSLVLGFRQVGGLEPLELNLYDRMVRIQGDRGLDPRLLMVTISEADLQQLQRATPSDQSVAEVIQTLAQHKPRAIGLDLHRDLPQEPGHEALIQQLQTHNVIAITKLSERDEDAIPPPPGLPSQQIGFSDLPIDADGIVRRNLMLAELNDQVFWSFSLRLALQYLAAESSALGLRENADYLQIGETQFFPLNRYSGGYRRADAAGYQILLSYRSPDHLARQVAFTDVLNGRIEPDWITDKVVLIGTTAPSSKDLFYTPYTAGREQSHQMPGVMIHGQMVSQILSAVLDDEPLFWFWAEWGEVIWIVSWAAIGGGLAWALRHPAILSLAGVTALAALCGASFFIFMQKGWVPIASPAIAFVITGGGVVVYRAHRMQKQQELATLFWQEHTPSSAPKKDSPR